MSYGILVTKVWSDFFFCGTLNLCPLLPILISVVCLGSSWVYSAGELECIGLLVSSLNLRLSTAFLPYCISHQRPDRTRINLAVFLVTNMKDLFFLYRWCLHEVTFETGDLAVKVCMNFHFLTNFMLQSLWWEHLAHFEPMWKDTNNWEIDRFLYHNFGFLRHCQPLFSNIFSGLWQKMKWVKGSRLAGEL